ncbi:non-hydrolyzing UDP-N-acetylglucosamine 2-epimerase [Cytobacillus oceanisediminis]|uniref:UDP-N-acetyl glucosamine 2-epimerase n=1 Tax=Cytobacillus oceanisediminis 2691 TaxID=1196031 RepID=A0A160MG81_9BACI|nr:UDP-N-acetylglucosamine 2-epimerase (non-hydrolyzing) [Cytobacillus oceanisediminis]AND42240.1 UDP-N-acetyl glucosamine 2-epimerase [Cytobacillus oceanisediminis 2691]
MKKIVTVVGARPQFIKLAPVSRVLRKHFEEIIVDTGQHYDHKMAGVFFEELQIPKPDYNLQVGSGTHGYQTGEMLIKIEEILIKEKPDAVLVYGDTNSTIAGSLSSAKLHIPVIHIEAGLRSYNKKMPEEVNRVLTDHISSLLFTPTETAVNNLSSEGVTENVFNVGDVMYDAVLYNTELAKSKDILSQYGVQPKEYILATIHRAENTDSPDRLTAIINQLGSLNQKVILPLHPRTKKKLEELNIVPNDSTSSLQIVEPAGYLEMLALEKNASAIVTDSGGVQKEAYFAKVPCFTLRNETEWVETVHAGWNKLVNPLEDNLSSLVSEKEEKPYIEGLYGDGKASEKIVDKIIQFFN